MSGHETENTNCLEGLTCPNCGQGESFQVVATSVFTITDNGADDHTDVEYDDDSFAYCTQCDWEGKWGDLSKKEEEP